MHPFHMLRVAGVFGGSSQSLIHYVFEISVERVVFRHHRDGPEEFCFQSQASLLHHPFLSEPTQVDSELHASVLSVLFFPE